MLHIFNMYISGMSCLLLMSHMVKVLLLQKHVVSHGPGITATLQPIVLTRFIHCISCPAENMVWSLSLGKLSLITKHFSILCLLHYFLGMLTRQMPYNHKASLVSSQLLISMAQNI